MLQRLTIPTPMNNFDSTNIQEGITSFVGNVVEAAAYTLGTQEGITSFVDNVVEAAAYTLGTQNMICITFLSHR